jgi:hypothetical protein
MLYFIIVNISVMMKNAKIEVDGLGGAVEVFVVGNELGDCSCGSVGGGAGGRPDVVDVDVVDVDVVDVVGFDVVGFDDIDYDWYIYYV